MKLIRIVILSGLLVLTELIHSCCNCNQTDELRSYIHSDTLYLDNLDNSGISPALSASDTVAKEAFGIRVSFPLEKLAMGTRKGGLFFSCSYACDCLVGEIYYPADSILSLVIQSDSTFDASHPGGSDVTSYFRVLGPDTLNLPAFYNPEEISGPWAPLYSMPHLQEVDFLLMTAPVSPGWYHFTVNVNFPGGRYARSETGVYLR